MLILELVAVLVVTVLTPVIVWYGLKAVEARRRVPSPTPTVCRQQADEAVGTALASAAKTCRAAEKARTDSRSADVR